jgi:DNA-binding MarR family transcriptional regulator
MEQDEIVSMDAKARLRSMAEFRYQLRRLMSFSETATETFGVGAQQYQLMQVIAAMPEGQEASISYIAERMVLRHNSAVELVDRAERAGLVKRETDAKDMRRSLVRMTAEGDGILQKLIAEHLRELPVLTADLMVALEHLRAAIAPVAADEASDEPGA